MTTPPVVVAPRTAARQAALRMDDEAVGCLLVAEGEHLCGILTDRDLAILTLGRGLAPDTPVSEFMSTPVVTLDVADDLETAYRLFRRSGLRRLPVLDGERPVGLLAVDDLFRDVLQRLADLLGPISWSVLRDDHPGPVEQPAE
ncbi:CBS domain-containing protein [Streptomyces tateyamensis]|nr:CBS domain-containing protein [Streptomyces tateyamensis]